MSILKIYSEDLIDPETGIHFAFHKSLKDITKEHMHDFFEIFLITSGSIIHIINGISQKLQEGTLVFIRPDDRHYYMKNLQESYGLLNVAFPRKTVDQLFTYLGEGFHPGSFLKSKLPPSAVIDKTALKIIREKIEKLNSFNIENKNEINTSLRILLVELFTKYFNTEKYKAGSSIPGWLSEARDEMYRKENFSEGFSAFRRLSGKSKEHLCREYKKYYMQTPTEFINDIRLNYSAGLLKNSDESIPFISIEAGFENLSHFYHLFRKKFGMSPGSYRKENRKLVIP